MHKINDSFEDPLLDNMMSREVFIDNRGNSNELADYQVNLVVDEKQLFFEAQDGLRFVDENLKIIDHWNESFPATQWLEVPKIVGSAAIALRMLDGDPSSTSVSNGDNTFLFFDDFPGTSLDTDKWTPAGSNITVSGSVINIGNSSNIVAKSAWSTTNTVQRQRSKRIADDINLLNAVSGLNYVLLQGYNGILRNLSKKDGNVDVECEYAAGTGWRIFDITRESTTKVIWYIDEVLKCTQTDTFYIPTINLFPKIYSAFDGESETDWTLIHKYTSPSPPAKIGMMI